MPEELDDTIRQNAQGPAKASGDAGNVEQHKLTDQIAADRHLASKDAVSKPRRGLRFNKLIPLGPRARTGRIPHNHPADPHALCTHLCCGAATAGDDSRGPGSSRCAG